MRRRPPIRSSSACWKMPSAREPASRRSARMRSGTANIGRTAMRAPMTMRSWPDLCVTFGGFPRFSGLARSGRVGAAVGDVAEPGAGPALGFGDLAGGHVLGDVGPAFLRGQIALERREVEPFVRFDEVDLDARGAGRIGDAKLVERVDIAHGRVGHPALDQKHAGFQAVRHYCPLASTSGGLCRAPMVNKSLTRVSG